MVTLCLFDLRCWQLVNVIDWEIPFLGRQNASPFFVCFHQAPAQRAKRIHAQTRECAYSSGMDSVVTVVWPPLVDHYAMTVSMLKNADLDNWEASRQYLKQESEALYYFRIRHFNELANPVKICKACAKNIHKIYWISFGQCAATNTDSLGLLHVMTCLTYWWLPVWNTPLPA